jgi:hypothetical protein
LATKIQLRRDVEAQWIANNPTLSSGEVGIATDKNKFKVGNGSDAWSSLEYLDSREAEKLQVERVIQLSGDVSGSVTFDGSASVNISTEIQPDSVSLGTDTTGDYVSSISASGDGVSVTGSGESASVTIENTGVTSLYGTSNQVDVSSSAGSVTISLPETIHRNLQGNVTGNSDTASSFQNARTIALGGDLSGSVSFDGSSSVTINATVQPDSVSLGTDTTGNYVTQVTGSGNGILVTGSGESASVNIENTGVHSLTGTANEVNVSASSGSITVGLPASVTIQSELNVLGNLTVSGSTTTINTQTLIVEDKNIEIGNVDEPTDITANNGGITLKGTTDKTFNWIDATDSWTSSEHIDLANGKVIKHNGTEILSSTQYTGNSATSSKLNTARVIQLSGDLSGSASFDGSASISINASVQPDSVTLGTDTTGNYVATIAGTSNQVSVSGSGSENAAVTISLPSTINVDTSGNSATATKLLTTREISLSGDVTGSANFDGSSSAGISATLSNSGVSASTYGSATNIPVITVDAKGRITSASVAEVVSLPSQAEQVGKFLTTDGEVASWSFVSASSLSGQVPLSLGGTSANLTAANGSVVYSTESALALTSVGNAGEVLTSTGSGAPTWQAASGGGFETAMFLGGM